MLGFGLDLWKIALMGGSSGAMALLSGEPQGMALDFTTAAGPQAGFGQAAVLDQGTPANNLSNAPADSFLTQSGTSPKLVLWSDGLYRWSPHNLLLQSETLNSINKFNSTVSSNATTAPDGTLTADKIVEDTNASQHIVYQTVTTVTGATYTISFRVKAAERTWAFVDPGTSSLAYINLATGAVGQVGAGNISTSSTPLGNGWYRFSVVFVAPGASNTSSIGGAVADGNSAPIGDGVSGIYAWGQQLNRGTVPATYHVTTSAAWFGVPIEYDPTTAKFYALVEPTATNLIGRSQTFGTAGAGGWSSGALTIADGNATGPDGATSASLLTADGTSAQHNVETVSSIVVSGTQYDLSILAKANTASFLHTLVTGANIYAQWNLSTGALVFSSAGTGALTVNPAVALTGTMAGWWRFSITFTQSSGSAQQVRFYPLAASNNTAGPSETSTASMWLWTADLEAGTVATSPIPTFGGTTITRSADNVSVATSAFPFSATAGTFRALFTNLVPSGGVSMIAELGDNSSAQRMYFTSNVGGTATQVVVRDGGVNLAAINGSAIAQGVPYKYAFAWAANDFALITSGNVAGTDASGTVPTVTTLWLGRDYNAAAMGPVRIAQIVYVPRRATNTELQAKTL